MRKGLFLVSIVLVLIVFAPGCAKKQIKPEPIQPEPAKVQKETEAVSESIYPVETAEVIAPQEKSLVEFNDVLFDYDKYDIRPDGKEVLDSVAPWLRKNKDVNVLVEGHCDERGTNEYNLALGEKRSTAAKNYLISKGITPNRINTISYGEEKPICLEHNEDCWQKNRRAHFVVTK